MSLQRRIRLIHRAWRYRLHAERNEIALVRSVLRPGDVVADIGAHKAAFTYWMAKQVVGGCVFAFEPNPQLAEYLREIAGDFPQNRVRVVETALSDRQGTAVLHFPGDHLGSASLELAEDVLQPPIEVATVSLDQYFESINWKTPLRLIKCDVEYHELAVLRGAERTLSRHKPILLVESGDFVNEPFRLQPVHRYLNEIGYRGCFFHKSRLVPIEHYDPATHTPVNDDHQNYVYAHADVEILSRMGWERNKGRIVAPICCLILLLGRMQRRSIIGGFTEINRRYSSMTATHDVTRPTNLKQLRESGWQSKSVQA